MLKWKAHVDALCRSVVPTPSTPATDVRLQIAADCQCWRTTDGSRPPVLCHATFDSHYSSLGHYDGRSVHAPLIPLNSWTSCYYIWRVSTTGEGRRHKRTSQRGHMGMPWPTDKTQHRRRVYPMTPGTRPPLHEHISWFIVCGESVFIDRLWTRQSPVFHHNVWRI